MDYMPSFVAKAGIKKWPLIGAITEATDAIYVDRLKVEKKADGPKPKSTTDLISERLNIPGKQSNVAMFPEGTTTNGSSIVHFRHGAFVPGVAIVPVVFKFHYLFFDPACSSYPVLNHLLQTMAQLSTWMTVEYLPVYYPSEEEKGCADLFSTNVKKAMVDSSGLKDSDFTYTDKLRWEAANGYENEDVKKQKKLRTSAKTKVKNATMALKTTIAKIHPEQMSRLPKAVPTKTTKSGKVYENSACEHNVELYLNRQTSMFLPSV